MMLMRKRNKRKMINCRRVNLIKLKIQLVLTIVGRIALISIFIKKSSKIHRKAFLTRNLIRTPGKVINTSKEI